MRDARAHKFEAENLLVEGQYINQRIQRCASRRDDLNQALEGLADTEEQAKIQAELQDLTTRMREQSRWRASIWAQAQVHATLATVSDGSNP